MGKVSNRRREVAAKNAKVAKIIIASEYLPQRRQAAKDLRKKLLSVLGAFAHWREEYPSRIYSIGAIELRYKLTSHALNRLD